VRILYVQDALCEANRTRRQLRKAAPHFELEVVSSQSEAIARLQQFETRMSAGSPGAVPSMTRKDQSCDLVLTDYASDRRGWALSFELYTEALSATCCCSHHRRGR
jgi:hypothetical protein